jgi:hypothetical protein
VTPPLRRIHSDETREVGSNRVTLEYWRKQTTDEIVKSLHPGTHESLKVKPAGGIMNGNMRVKVLEERGVDVNSFPRGVLP